jgi:hypothetical protein
MGDHDGGVDGGKAASTRLVASFPSGPSPERVSPTLHGPRGDCAAHSVRRLGRHVRCSPALGVMTEGTESGRNEGSGAAETVSADERRTWLEGLAFDPDPMKRRLDPMVLGSVGQFVVSPAGERFEGEARALVALLAERSADAPFDTKILVLAAIEVWAAGREGSPASRVALVRAATAFVLHNEATRMVLHARETVTPEP